MLCLLLSLRVPGSKLNVFLPEVADYVAALLVGRLYLKTCKLTYSRLPIPLDSISPTWRQHAENHLFYVIGLRYAKMK